MKFPWFKSKWPAGSAAAETEAAFKELYAKIDGLEAAAAKAGAAAAGLNALTPLATPTPPPVVVNLPGATLSPQVTTPWAMYSSFHTAMGTYAITGTTCILYNQYPGSTNHLPFTPAAPPPPPVPQPPKSKLLPMFRTEMRKLILPTP